VEQIDGLPALAALVASPLGGWVVAFLMNRRAEAKDKLMLDKMAEKDQQLLNKHDAHIRTLEDAGKRCDENFNVLMGRVFQLEDKKADK
jgi:hypothetical protein